MPYKQKLWEKNSKLPTEPHQRLCVAHITIRVVLVYLLTVTHYYGDNETQRPRPNLLSHAWLRFDFFSTNQWARFRPHYNSHHKWWTAQHSAGMPTNPADANCQCQDYTNIFHPICWEHFAVFVIHTWAKYKQEAVCKYMASSTCIWVYLFTTFNIICFFCHILGAYQHHTLSHFLLWHEILWAWVPLPCCLHQCLYYQSAIGHFPTKIRLCVAHISLGWSIWPIIKNTPGMCALQASLTSIFSFAHVLALFQYSVCSTCWLSGVFITQVLS